MASVVPLRLHSHQPDRAGVPQMTPQFLAYLSTALAGQRQASRAYRYTHWWTPDWAESELRAHFPAEYVEAVLAVRREGMDVQVAADRALLTRPTLGMLMRQMADHCRARL